MTERKTEQRKTEQQKTEAGKNTTKEWMNKRHKHIDTDIKKRQKERQRETSNSCRTHTRKNDR